MKSASGWGGIWVWRDAHRAAVTAATTRTAACNEKTENERGEEMPIHVGEYIATSTGDQPKLVRSDTIFQLVRPKGAASSVAIADHLA